MVQSRTLTSACFTLAMAIQAIWMGCPGVGCVCPDGRVKLFCDAYFAAASISKNRSRASEARSCCDQALASRGGGDCPGHPGTGLSGRGCTRVVETPVLATAPAKDFAPDFTPGFGETAAVCSDAAPEPYFPTRLTRTDTGPPTDLVLTLHRLLI